MDTPLLSLEIKRKELLFQSFFNCFIGVICMIGVFFTQPIISYIIFVVALLLFTAGVYDIGLSRSTCYFYAHEIRLTIGLKKAIIPIDSITAFDWQSFNTNYGVLRIHTSTQIYTLPKRIFAHLKEIKVIQESLQIKDF